MAARHHNVTEDHQYTSLVMALVFIKRPLRRPVGATEVTLLVIYSVISPIVGVADILQSSGRKLRGIPEPKRQNATIY